MMSDPDTIDIVADDPETGKLLLVMTEHRPWRKEAQMHKEFHAKANAHAQYVCSEQFSKDHPGLKPSDVIVKLDCAHEPGSKTMAFFEEISRGLAQYGIGFEYEVCQDDDDLDLDW